MSFIVIEGLDASGKSTQVARLLSYLKSNNLEYRYLHFPRTGSALFGNLVAKFLRGELGPLDEVDPYVVASIYAGDRFDARNTLVKWIEEGNYVIIDRYVYSNMAFQCAKIYDKTKKKELRQWISDLEFGLYNLPVPDISIFLDAPFEFTKSQLSQNRQGDDRGYLLGKTDIHEADINFQQVVKEEYILMTQQIDNFFLIDCSDHLGKMLEEQLIFEKIINLFLEKSIINISKD